MGDEDGADDGGTELGGTDEGGTDEGGTDDGGTDEGGTDDGTDEGGGLPGVRLVNPNQSSTSLARSGTVWPTPCARIAWTLGPNDAREYPLSGLLVRFVVGVCDTPKTFVHCLMSSQKF